MNDLGNHIILWGKTKHFHKHKGFGLPLYLLILLSVFRFYSATGQNFYETEGRQKVQIFEDGTYRIMEKNGVDFFSLYKLDSLDDVRKTEARANIIEAEYFVTLHVMQKEIDILETALKRVKKEGNTSEMNDYTKKIKEIKEKMKDISGLYDNALFFQKQARKAVLFPENFNVKNRQKLDAYIESKDYIFKTTKYVKGEKQIWRNRELENTYINTTSNPKPITEAVTANLPEKQMVLQGNCRTFREDFGTSISIFHEFEPMFCYTPQRLKVHLKDENLMECNAQVSQVGKENFLTLRIVMRTKDAAKSYGHIQEGNMLRLGFVNGIRLNLKASESVFGSFEEYSGKVVYVAKFKLDKEMLKQLQNLPLDYLGIMWTSGFEKYEIFEVDVLMRQLECLKSLKNI